ncbi:hypothetical protein ACF09J_24520 [Streptomyces sp. NPDC014889]
MSSAKTAPRDLLIGRLRYKGTLIRTGADSYRLKIPRSEHRSSRRS